MFRIAVNVHSSVKPPDLLFQSLTSLPDALTSGLEGPENPNTRPSSRRHRR